MKYLLTKKELQIFYLCIKGLSCKDISRSLNISIYTVQKHRVHLLDKLGMKNVAQIRFLLKNHNAVYNNLSLSSLTNKEIDVALLLISGDTYKEISKKLLIQPSTVAKHRENIYRKLNVHCVLDLSIALFSLEESTSPPQQRLPTPDEVI